VSIPWAVAIVLLACATGALAVITLSLVRQLGVLAIRLNPSAGMQTAEGPGPGTELRAVDVPLLSGGTVQLGGERSDPQLVVFLSPDCSICSTVANHTETVMRQYRDVLDVLIVIDATPRVAREYVRDHRFAGAPVMLKQGFPSTIGISTTPFALAITREGVVADRGVPNALEHLEELVRRATVFDPDEAGVRLPDSPTSLTITEGNVARATEGSRS